MITAILCFYFFGVGWAYATLIGYRREGYDRFTQMLAALMWPVCVLAVIVTSAIEVLYKRGRL